jgi:bifunctional DNA-binding transcriptional regulator/antitoxin component of YhaV-PrlF toxin-antitoxin module
MLCKRTYKNQITLPKKIMEKFDDVEYFEVEAKEDRIILRPVKINLLRNASLAQIRENIAALHLTEKDIEEAITWARKK